MFLWAEMTPGVPITEKTHDEFEVHLNIDLLVKPIDTRRKAC